MELFNMGKFHEVLDYTVLGVAVISGLVGLPGLAITGVAIYLIGVKLDKKHKTKG